MHFFVGSPASIAGFFLRAPATTGLLQKQRPAIARRPVGIHVACTEWFQFGLSVPFAK
jgi:hypothetical protein